MLLYIGKVILLYSVSVIVIRLLGKAAFAQLTSHDLTAILFLATLGVHPLLEESFDRIFTGIAVVTLLHILFTRLVLFRWLNRLLIGQPAILIKHGKINKSKLLRSRFSLVELLATLRAGGYPDIKDVEYAILEPNGQISIVPMKDVVAVTPRHLNLKMEYQGLPIAVVVEGKVQRKNVALIGKDETWLRQELKAAGHPDIRDVFYAAIRDSDHSLTIDTGEGEMFYRGRQSTSEAERS
ncbi:DUF421 domain-containing protein [Paenibacillus harenae]|uniref:DUF421 domain-containing protein n=1 Tax=Paenibacillus harenae TaxID=306543 RepID=UPI00042988C8|nr:YetF domain-containing protein [Paenibacillus harenae]